MKAWTSIAAASALFGALACAQAASAAVVLQDNFDTDTATLNWPGDATFTSIPAPGNVNGSPSVDLVGASDGFGSLAYSGNSVDLDGSTGTGFSPAGEIQSVASLGTGTYTVSFELAGNMRGAPAQNLTVSVGGQSQTFSVPASDGYSLKTLTFSNASGQVSFTDDGPATQQGMLLDNIVVSSVPEPATWEVMLMGFGGLGAAMRNKRRKLATATA
jgi:hypothetical protein